MELEPVRTLTVERPMASGHAFLSAASGLVVVGDTFYVVADDARELAVFALGNDAPGRLFELIPGSLPHDAAARKKQKPDFEILLHLPKAGSAGDEGGDSGALLALGSGSKKKRMVGALIGLSRERLPGNVRIIDLAPLYAMIAPLVAEVNLEGAVVAGDRLLLFNRGNQDAPESCIIETSLAALLAGCAVDARPAARFTLPAIDGMRLTVTDAAMLPDGFLLSAAAEATDNAYADGALAGAALVGLNAHLAITGIERIEPAIKIEGIAIGPADELLCVTDADNPDCPAVLYRVDMGHADQ